MAANFAPTDPDLFFTRNDPSDPRLGETVKPVTQLDLQTLDVQNSSANSPFVLAGYPDDDGIKLSGGRIGAALAPSLVRKYLYRMTPNFLASSAERSPLFDLGNLSMPDSPTEQRHALARKTSTAVLSKGARWLAIGGGHDYGYADAAGYLDWFYSVHKQTGLRPLVINFDAHLDVRPTSHGLSSGTPFYRMLEEFPDVDFAEIGIQTQCNSQVHFAWAKARGVRVLTQEEIETSGETFTTMALRTLGDWIVRPRPVFLSVDIDGFSSSEAPGCSQSWATGFTAKDFFPCLQVLTRRLEIKALGIYEVSPALDQDNRTSKLAAQVIHRVLDPM